ncbi:MAG: hypothetical protein IKO07_11370 [Clostridia bacterium]|nr:hypothetical protein [Clostridia bacterium]
MKTIRIYDATMRQMASAQNSALTFREKLEIVRALDKLKIDTIELPRIEDAKADSLLNRTVASMIATEISATVGLDAGSVKEAWESIRAAKKPVLHVMLPVSTVQMEYICRKKAPAMLKLIEELVSACRFYCETVEFSAQDATRAEPAFLAQAVQAAIGAGASRVTLCDTAGLMTPVEFGEFLRGVQAAAPALNGVQLNVEFSNALSMASACAAQAAACGAAGVKTTVSRMDITPLEDFAQFLKARGADLGLEAGTRFTELTRTVRQLEWMLSPKKENAVIQTADAGAMANICLDVNDSIGEVVKVVNQLGYDLSEEDNARVYEAFRRVAEKKNFVGTKELEAIVASSALQVPSTYHLDSYVINSGNIITATANISLEKDGKKMRGMSVGDGPIDAAFLAIEQIIGHHYELDDFQIQSITEGREAMGSALVKLRAGGRLYSGNGISTDIIGASIRAYINALNKIVYEEG